MALTGVPGGEDLRLWLTFRELPDLACCAALVTLGDVVVKGWPNEIESAAGRVVGAFGGLAKGNAMALARLEIHRDELRIGQGREMLGGVDEVALGRPGGGG